MKAFQEFSLVWIIVSILLLFAGFFLWITAGLTGNRQIGVFFLAAGGFSFFIFLLTTALNIFRAGKYSTTEAFNYVLVALSLFSLLTGITLSFLLKNSPWGMRLIFAGVGGFILFWLFFLVKNIISVEKK